MKWILLVIIIVSAFTLNACRHVSINHYAETQPPIKLKDFFIGETKAWGLVRNYKGEVIRRFVVEMKGTVEGSVLTLDEQFVLANGEQEQRIWHLVFTDDGRFIGTAADVIGQAKGQQAGFAAFMQYVLQVPVNNKEYQLTIQDWFYQIDQQVLINMSKMKKFGFTVGEIVVVFKKPD